MPVQEIYMIFIQLLVLASVGLLACTNPLGWTCAGLAVFNLWRVVRS